MIRAIISWFDRRIDARIAADHARRQADAARITNLEARLSALENVAPARV